MSQLGRKAGPEPSGPARDSPGPGTFEGVAGFRIGRGRDNGAPHTRPQQPPYGQQAPQGPSYGGYPAPPSHPHPGQQQYGGPQGGGYDEPEYFGDGGHDPYAANNPGHTQAFSVGEDPYNQGGTYRAGSTPPAGPVGPASTGRTS